MAYKRKTEEERENSEQRQYHVDLPKSDRRFDKMLSESLAIYDQGLYFLRQEYFRCRDLDWAESPSYDSWFDLCDKTKETSAWTDSSLDINVKKLTLKKCRDSWTVWLKSKKDYKIHPDKYLSAPQMPKYKYRQQNYFEVIIDKTRFRGSDENEIKLPCTDISIQIPKSIKKEWIIEIHILKHYGRTRIIFVYDYKKLCEYERQLSDASGKTHSTAVRTDDREERRRKRMEDKQKLIDNFVPDKNRFLSIDFGMVNIVTAMTFGCGAADESFIIRGRYFQQRINETVEEISRLFTVDMIFEQSCHFSKINKMRLFDFHHFKEK